MQPITPKERAIRAAVRVAKAAEEYERALAENYIVEEETRVWDWPVAEIIECVAESRKRAGMAPKDEDDVLTFLEQREADVRQRYAQERASRDAQLEEAFDLDPEIEKPIEFVAIAASSYRESGD